MQGREKPHNDHKTSGKSQEILHKVVKENKKASSHREKSHYKEAAEVCQEKEAARLPSPTSEMLSPVGAASLRDGAPEKIWASLGGRSTLRPGHPWMAQEAIREGQAERPHLPLALLKLSSHQVKLPGRDAMKVPTVSFRPDSSPLPFHGREEVRWRP